jgi:hypothetical protein
MDIIFQHFQSKLGLPTKKYQLLATESSKEGVVTLACYRTLGHHKLKLAFIGEFNIKILAFKNAVPIALPVLCNPPPQKKM